MRFESGLARKISQRKERGRAWKTYSSFVGVIFIVLTLTSSTLAAPHAVIHVGSQTSVAKYLGLFEGHDDVLMLGTMSSEDWIVIKMPFKGRLSALDSVSFSAFLVQTGDLQVEPYVILKLPEGRYLVCHPESSYSEGGWSLPYFCWQARDTVSHGKWQIAPVETQSMLVPLKTWTWLIGDVQVISVSFVVGGWDIEKPYQCYIGDLSINGKRVNIANAGRASGMTDESLLFF